MTASTSERAAHWQTADLADRRIAGLAALAVVIHLLEAALPSPLPGIKPGLANAVVLYALLRHGWRVAAWVALLRVLVSGLLLGHFLSPGFFLSLAGAVASLLVLALAWRLPGLSGVGLGVLAALAHVSGQFALAYLWLMPDPGLFYLLPPFLTAAWLFGIATGGLVNRLLARAS